MEENKTVNSKTLRVAVDLRNENLDNQLQSVIDLTSDDKTERRVSFSAIGRLINPKVKNIPNITSRFKNQMMGGK